MKIAEHQTLCPLCEDKIEVGDDIEYCHIRREWHHFSCPWTRDEGYRPDMVILDPDMVIIDADDDEIIDIMKHEKNKEKDRVIKVINEQPPGLESGESVDRQLLEGEWKELPKEGSWLSKLWKSVGDFFQF